jgi:thiol-disulfide isomerase/thioredoxin
MNRFASSFKSMMSSKSLVPTTWMGKLTALVVAVVVLLCLYAIVNYYSGRGRGGGRESMETIEASSVGGSGGGSDVELIFFYVDWCPHCKTAKPSWDKLKQQEQGKTRKGSTVTFTEINCTKETDDVTRMMNQYKVEGYPTIKLRKDGQTFDYEAKPQVPELTIFLDKTVGTTDPLLSS